jgi:low molecular weight protein-tyrosine phosphatase
MTETQPLPPARTPGRYRIGVVCSGNICRSPTAEVVLTARLAEAGLGDLVTVESCGLGDWHAGDPMDARSAAVLTAAGYDASRHRAQVLPLSWSAEPDGLDLLLAMDAGHRRDLLAGGASPERVRLFCDFDPVDPGADVPDPYYGGPDGFEEVLGMVERTSEVLADLLAARLEQGRR